MNYQMKEDLREKTAKILGCDFYNIEYYAFPEVFSSTAGAFGGIGGQALSTFTTEAFCDAVTGEAVLFQNGMPFKRVKNFSCNLNYERVKT